MSNLYFSCASPYLKAAQFLESVLITDEKNFKTTFHAPELGVKRGEYYVVEVRQVIVPELEETDKEAS